MFPSLLSGKTALVTGVADNVGFAWHIAQHLQAAGAQVILSCHPRITSILERFLTRDKYAESRKLPGGTGTLSPLATIPCDVADDQSVADLTAQVGALTPHLDIVVHSVAFSPEISKSHIETSREAYLTAMSVSSYSLVTLTRSVLPLMRDRKGAVLALSYMASERIVPYYGGGMASAKAALECDARMLSWFIGEHGHRVNIISAGPYASRAAKAVGDIESMIAHTAERSPLRRPITPQEVAQTALFLCSDWASGITAEVVHVDAGYHAMGA